MSSDEKDPKEETSKTEPEEPESESASGGTTGETVDKEQTTSDKSTSDALPDLFQQVLRIKQLEPKLESLLDEVTFEGIAKYINSDKCKKIVTMAGAGISTSAGIPDFRSPGTGLYDNLEKYNLPNPMSVFEIGYFRQNPEPFFFLCKELFPKQQFKPTPCHYFIRLLEKKNLLMAHFTQNIDTLERETGLSGENLIEAHGTFNTGHCLECSEVYTRDWMKEKIFEEDPVLKCIKKGCEGVVKPDIVFFGECLPQTFVQRLSDLKEADLLIILGTSLVVQPFASLTGRVRKDIPRLYINMEKTSASDFDPMMLLMGSGFAFDSEDNIRDVFWQGKCDDGCYALADLLGWGDELRKLVKDEHSRIDEENAKQEKKLTEKAKV